MIIFTVHIMYKHKCTLVTIQSSFEAGGGVSLATTKICEGMIQVCLIQSSSFCFFKVHQVPLITSSQRTTTKQIDKMPKVFVALNRPFFLLSGGSIQCMITCFNTDATRKLSFYNNSKANYSLPDSKVQGHTIQQVLSHRTG